jgi:hypothetical protein
MVEFFDNGISMGAPVTLTGITATFTTTLPPGTHQITAVYSGDLTYITSTGTFSQFVNALPTVSAGASLCAGSAITISPTAGGTWVSSNPAVATITNAGVVTGVAGGTVTFTFTETATGCSNTTT